MRSVPIRQALNKMENEWPSERRTEFEILFKPALKRMWYKPNEPDPEERNPTEVF
jgi:hypothetical protein